MIYQWGSRTFSVDAQTVGDTVERLAVQHGGVCPPSALVEESRPLDAPTHPLFTWDDEIAAEAWRRQQARSVINSIKVTMDDGEQSKSPAFVHVSLVGDEGPREGYASTLSVMSDEEQREQVLAEVRRYLNGFRRRYQHLSVLTPLFQAMDKLELDA